MNAAKLSVAAKRIIVRGKKMAEAQSWQKIEVKWWVWECIKCGMHTDVELSVCPRCATRTQWWKWECPDCGYRCDTELCSCPACFDRMMAGHEREREREAEEVNRGIRGIWGRFVEKIKGEGGEE